MNFVNKMLVLPFLVLSVVYAGAASSDRQGVIVATSSEVQACQFKGDIVSASGQIKRHNWKRHATHRAQLKAEKLGATHLVIRETEPSGVFHGKVKAQAYSCAKVFSSM